jgi:hypothetical protein
MRTHIASYRSVVRFTARDPVIMIVEAELASRPVPEILRLHRFSVSPQADSCSAGRILSSSIDSSVRGALQALVLLIVPGHASFYLVEINIFAIGQKYLAD